MGDSAVEMRELYEELKSLNARLNKLKRETAIGEVESFSLRSAQGSPIALGDLFGKHKDLIVIQSMGRNCPYCTLWADSLIGAAKHIESRAALALISPDPPADLQAFANSRGWPFQLASSEGSEFKHALGFETDDGSFLPGVSTFRRDGDRIVNVANDMFGPGDSYCAVWHFWDLLEGGADGWSPKFSY